MKKLIVFILLQTVVCCPRPANAAPAGATLFNFLSLDTNVRSAAMGGAYTALAAGAGALHYNPAGLASTERQQAAFMHNQYFQGITQEYLSYASPKGWGADFTSLNFGGISETTLANPSGAGLGKVGMLDTALGLGFGGKLAGGLFVGAGVKLVRESIAGNSVSGFMFDGGLLWNVSGADGLALGVAVRNLGPDVKTQGGKEPLPAGVSAGVAYALKMRGVKSTISMDVQQNRGEGLGGRLGYEMLLGGAVPLRVGYNTLTDDGAGVSAGIGYIQGNLGFDYAYAPFKTLGAAHRLSVTYRWGE